MTEVKIKLSQFVWNIIHDINLLREWNNSISFMRLEEVSNLKVAQTNLLKLAERLEKEGK